MKFAGIQWLARIEQRLAVSYAAALADRDADEMAATLCAWHLVRELRSGRTPSPTFFVDAFSPGGELVRRA